MTVRVSGAPISVPTGVTVEMKESVVSIKGSKGELSLPIPEAVEVNFEENTLKIKPNTALPNAYALAGTIRARLNNNVIGVTEGFKKELLLKGVGYRVKVSKEGQLHKATLHLGYSHHIDYVAPAGIEFASGVQDQLVITGVDKQRVGQVAAEIRALRPPEPYKGKGVRYVDEYVAIKEAKKQ